MSSYPTTPDAFDRLARNYDLFATVIGFPAPEPGEAALAIAAGLALCALTRVRRAAGISSPAARACGAR